MREVRSGSMRDRSLTVGLGLLVALGACGFKPAQGGSGDGGMTDGSADAPTTSDQCTTECAWGCLASPTPHCGQLVPAGGAVLDTDFTGLVDVTINTSIDTGDGNGMKPKLDTVMWGDIRQVAGVT